MSICMVLYIIILKSIFYPLTFIFHYSTSKIKIIVPPIYGWLMQIPTFTVSQKRSLLVEGLTIIKSFKIIIH
jgi:hypothetical protein